MTANVTLTPASNSQSGSGVTEGRRDKLTSQDGDDDANVPRLQTDEAGEGGGRHVSEGADMAAEPHKIRYNVLHSRRPRLRQEEATTQREGRKWGGGGRRANRAYRVRGHRLQLVESSRISIEDILITYNTSIYRGRRKRAAGLTSRLPRETSACLHGIRATPLAPGTKSTSPNYLLA